MNGPRRSTRRCSTCWRGPGGRCRRRWRDDHLHQRPRVRRHRDAAGHAHGDARWQPDRFGLRGAGRQGRDRSWRHDADAGPDHLPLSSRFLQVHSRHGHGGRTAGQGTAARRADGDRGAQLRRAAGKRLHRLCRRHRRPRHRRIAQDRHRAGHHSGPTHSRLQPAHRHHRRRQRQQELVARVPQRRHRRLRRRAGRNAQDGPRIHPARGGDDQDLRQFGPRRTALAGRRAPWRATKSPRWSRPRICAGRKFAHMRRRARRSANASSSASISSTMATRSTRRSSP